MIRSSRRNALIASLAGQLADSRAREAALRERLDWFSAAMADEPKFAPLLLIGGGEDYAPRRSPSLWVARSS